MTRPQLVLGALGALLVMGVAERAVTSVAGASAQTSPVPPVFDVDPRWPTLPAQWTLGQVTGVAVDASDHVWVLHRPWSLTDDEKAQNPEAACCTAAPPVLEFDAAGRYLRSWGGPGAGYEWPEDEHAIHVDHKRNVWITSAGGPRLRDGKENMILKFTSDGRFLLQTNTFPIFPSSNTLQQISIFSTILSRLAAPIYPRVSNIILSSGVATLAHFFASLTHFIFLVLARCLMKCLS